MSYRSLTPDKRGRVSNPDLPGSYWQDQDDNGRDAGWGAGARSPRRSDSAWDDGGSGFFVAIRAVT